MQLGKFLSQTGYSLTEIMVAMGLLGGVSMVGIKLVEENASNESYIRFKSEVSKATSIIQTHLSNRDTCQSMIGGRPRYNNPSIPTVAPYINGTGQLTFVNKANGSTVVLLEHGRDYDGFRIPTGGILLATSKTNTATNPVTDLVIVFDIRKKGFFSRRSGASDRIIRRIPIKTEMTGSTVRSCGAVVADANVAAKQQLCASLTTGVANWNPVTSECELEEFKCPMGQVPFQMTSLGSFQCIPAENKIDPDQIFDYSPSSCTPGQNVRLTTGADGKIRAECY